jgi:molybdopterin-guanine dinucleotide biosynthesis protein B
MFDSCQPSKTARDNLKVNPSIRKQSFAFAVIGASGSGKTRLVVQLIRELENRGASVATIKHASHGHEGPPPTKDSELAFAAGALTSVVISEGLTTVRRREKGTAKLDTAVQDWCGEVDYVIIEGFKAEKFPMVFVSGGDRPIDITDRVIATVGSDPVIGQNLTNYSNDADGVFKLANQLEELKSLAID